MSKLVLEKQSFVLLYFLADFFRALLLPEWIPDGCYARAIGIIPDPTTLQSWIFLILCL